MDDRAQISAEFIIIMAAVLAVAIIMIKTLNSTAKDASGKLESSAKSVLKEIDDIA